MAIRSKTVRAVADTAGKISDNRVARKRLKDAGNEAQRELNRIDAQTGGFFRAGWRPMLCWFAVLLFVWNHGVGEVVGQALTWYEFSHIGDDAADNLVWVLLGLGTVRTAEKTRSWWGRRK